MLTPVGMAMMFRAFAPSERAQAGAVISIPAAVAPATGPVLGGYLVEYQSWHWIFLANIPIGVIALVVAGLFLREEKQAAPGRLDVPGFLLSASGLAILLYALAEAGRRHLDDPRVVVLSLVGIALLALFAVVELRTREPLIDIRLFRDKLFRAVNIMWLPGQAAFIGVLFLLPLLLQAEMGLTPLESGLTTFPMAIGVGLMAQPAGRIYRFVGPRPLLAVGMTGHATDDSFLPAGRPGDEPVVDQADHVRPRLLLRVHNGPRPGRCVRYDPAQGHRDEQPPSAVPYRRSPPASASP